MESGAIRRPPADDVDVLAGFRQMAQSAVLSADDGRFVVGDDAVALVEDRKRGRWSGRRPWASRCLP